MANDRSKLVNPIATATVGLLFLAHSDTSPAEIYKWTDESGNTHYGEAPGSGQEAQKLDVDTSAVGTVAPTTKYERVVMYATSWCGYCRQARTFFRANRIDYVEYDIEKDRSARRRYDALGGVGVPVILIGQKRMNGFTEAEFNAIYR